MSQVFYMLGNDGNKYPFPREGNLTLGKQGDDIVINSPDVVSRHVTLIVSRNRVIIKPESGTVLLNGVRLESMQKLEVGHTFSLSATGNAFRLTLQEYSASIAIPPAHQPTKPLEAPKIISKQSMFGLGDTMFADPVMPIALAPQPPPTPPVVPPTISTPPPAVAPMPRPSILFASTKSQPPPQVQSPPISNGHSSLSDAECRSVLSTFFDNAYIYEEKKGSNQISRSNNSSGSMGLLGTALVLLEAYNERQRKKAKPADFVDQAIQQTVFDLISVAQNEVGIVSALRDPLVIYGPIFWRASGIPLKNICARKGEDGFIRFSAQKVSVLLLDEDLIGIYTCHLDTITKRIGYAQTHMYTYKDITSITDQDTVDRIEMEGGVKEVTVHAFRIVVPGDNLLVTLNSPVIRDMFDGDAAQQPEHKQSLNIIRQLWLTKKQGK